MVLIAKMSKVPAAKYNTITPTIRPMSPTRLVRNAFSAALLFSFSSHQCPISTKEQTPTSSQPTIICKMLDDSTKNSIDAVNKLRNAKKCTNRRSPLTYSAA